jgi:hypothetical protein
MIVAEHLSRLFVGPLFVLPELNVLLVGAWIFGAPLLVWLGPLASAMIFPRRAWLDVDAGGVRVTLEPLARAMICPPRAWVRTRCHRAWVIPVSDVAAGLALDTESGPALELHLCDGRVLRARVEDKRDSRAVLERLGLGPERRRIAITLGGESWRLGYTAFLVAAIATLAAADNLGPVTVLVALLVTAVVPLARRLTAPAQVVIGAEGVVIRRGRRPEVVPFADIERAWSESRLGDDGRLILQLRGRRGARLRRIVVRGDFELATGLADRIHEALATARREAVAAAVRLDPEGRSVAEWRAALAGLLHGNAGYRIAAVGADDLIAMVGDASAPAPWRIGAALALRESDHPEARARVRFAADACADDEVRAALEAAAAEELDETPIQRVISER